MLHNRLDTRRQPKTFLRTATRTAAKFATGSADMELAILIRIAFNETGDIAGGCWGGLVKQTTTFLCRTS